MPNIKSAKKRVLISEKKHNNNVAAKSSLKTSVKKARVAVAENADNKDEVVKSAIVKIDKSAAKGLIHKNNAARKKSRLTKALNAKAAEKEE